MASVVRIVNWSWVQSTCGFEAACVELRVLVGDGGAYGINFTKEEGREIEDIKIRSSYVLSLLMCLPISQFRVKWARAVVNSARLVT